MKEDEQQVADRLAVVWVIIGLLVIAGLGFNALRAAPQSEEPRNVAVAAGNQGPRNHQDVIVPGLVPIEAPVGKQVAGAASRTQSNNSTYDKLIEVSVPNMQPVDGQGFAAHAPQIAQVQAEVGVDSSVLDQPQELEQVTAVKSVLEAGDARDDSPHLEVGNTSPPEGPSSATKNVERGKPFFGVGIREPNSNRVTTLYARSTAARLGIKLGDYLKSVNGNKVSDIDGLVELLSGMQIGDAIAATILRDGETRSFGPIPLRGRSSRD